MREVFSFILLMLLVAPTAGALFIVARNELVIDHKKTGGTGFVVILGVGVIFVVMPLFAYFVRF